MKLTFNTARLFDDLRTWLIATLVSLLPLCSQASGQVMATCYVSEGRCESIDESGPATIASGTSIVDAPRGTVYANGRAGFGVLGASAGVTVTNDGSSSSAVRQSNSGSADVEVINADLLSISSPTLAGQRGSLLAPLLLSGSVNTSISGPEPLDFQDASLYWRVFYETLDLNGNTLGQAGVSGKSTANYSALVPSVVPPKLMMALPFVFGQPFYLVGNLRVLANASSLAPGVSPDDPSYSFTRGAEANGDLYHTARWGGISQVYDAGGTAVTGWAVNSESGTDYSVTVLTAVPEPLSALLMLSGLLAIGTVVRHRRTVK